MTKTSSNRDDLNRNFASAFVFFSVLAALVCLAWFQINAPDYWWHLANGKHTLEAKSFHFADPFSLHERGAKLPADAMGVGSRDVSRARCGRPRGHDRAQARDSGGHVFDPRRGDASVRGVRAAYGRASLRGAASRAFSFRDTARSRHVSRARDRLVDRASISRGRDRACAPVAPARHDNLGAVSQRRTVRDSDARGHSRR